jgi:CheY-like chemotaxis protein
MGALKSKPVHTVSITVEQFVLEPPYDSEILNTTENPVVYVRQNNGEKLLTFTKYPVSVVGISATWNEILELELREGDPASVQLYVGENPRYHGEIFDIREQVGEQLVEIVEFDEKGYEVGVAGLLRVEITQSYRPAIEPPAPKVSTLLKPGFDTNISVFLYEAKSVHKKLIRNKHAVASSGKRDFSQLKMDVELLLDVPIDEPSQTPSTVHINKEVLLKGSTFNPVWNEGFHWNNLREQPRFLDIRLNYNSDIDEERGLCRVDLLNRDVWGKGQNWTWHPIIPMDQQPMTEARVLIVDDNADDARRLYSMLEALQLTPELELRGSQALEELEMNHCKRLKKTKVIFINIRQRVGMDGITFANKVRDLEEEYGLDETVIVGIDKRTDNSNLARDRRYLQSLGLDDLLFKPLLKDDVRWVMQRHARNLGLVLLDIVVTHTRRDENTMQNYIEETDNDRNSRKVAKAEQDSVLELRVESAELLDTIPENHCVVYIVTMNHQMLESKTRIKASNGPILRKDPIEWHEDIRFWVNRADFRRRQLKLGIAVYAFPSGNSTWRSEDLIGRWRSEDQNEDFWAACDDNYFSSKVLLVWDDGESLRKRGTVEISAILRPVQEIITRQLHDAYERSCDRFNRVGRGEVSKLLPLITPIVSPIDAYGDMMNTDEKKQEVDEFGTPIPQPPTRYNNQALTLIERFCKASAHYTEHGEAYLNENAVLELIDRAKADEL